MNIPQSAIASFEPHGIPTLSPMEPPVHNWAEDLVHRIRRAPTREVWYIGPDDDADLFWVPYIPMTTNKIDE
jgi:hypothetical protein